jgi:hypothetical protein
MVSLLDWRYPISIYSQATLGEPDNQIQFNDISSDPYFRVVSRAPQKFQIRQQDLPVPFESGSDDFLTLIGDSAYIIQGIMYPSTELKYDEGLQLIRSVSSLDLQQADILSDEGYVPYIWGNANGNLQTVFMKVLYAQLAETTAQGFVQPFVLYAKVIDPTIYLGIEQQASTAGTGSPYTTGNAAFPFTFPVVFGAELYTVNAAAFNTGSLPVYPRAVTIYGPITNPKLTNVTTGEFISINVTLGSSDVLSLSYNNTKQIANLNGANVLKSVSTDSTFWKVHPGTNVMSLSGTSSGTGAYATVTYLSGSPLA